MSFYTTNHLGNTLHLWLAEHDWSIPPRIVHILDTQIEAGLSSRENRRPVYEAMRLQQTISLVLADTEANALLAQLRSSRTEYIGMPIYADAWPLEDWPDRIYNPQYAIAFDETGYDIYETASVPGAIARSQIAPLLVGHLREQPRLRGLAEGVCELSVTLVEDSPWDDRIGVMPEVVAADWPEALVPNAIEDPETSHEDIVEFDELGHSRTIAIDGQEDTPQRTQRMIYTLDASEIRQLLNFWLARKGATQAFEMPLAFIPGDDTPDTPHATSVRFDQDRLDLSFASPRCADVRIRFAELPWEVAGVVGETPEQNPFTWLYRFWLDVPGGPVEWLYTSYEKPITFGGQEYASIPIEHDAIQTTIDLSDSPVTITSYAVAGSPLLDVLKQQLDVPLHVSIRKVQPANPDVDSELKYLGEVESVDGRGRILTADTRVLGGVLETKVPRFRLGQNCNYRFCGPGCGRAIAVWTFTATVVSQVGSVLTCTIVNNPTAANIVTDYFAKGYLTKGTGASYELRQIVRSSVAGSNLVLTLKKPLRAVTAGLALSIVPHCSGTWEECRTKYNLTDEWHNFGGHRHIQSRNPSVPALNTSSGGGGKKG